MRIAILGYGVEGKSVEKYFSNQGHEIKVFDKFTLADLKDFKLETYDLVFRTPSVNPEAVKQYTEKCTSITEYFIKSCPAPIIGVTGTKGKGTTCSFIAAILKSIFNEAHGRDPVAVKETDTNHPRTVHLVGNIGVPALDILHKVRPEDVVVYEMSSFQLWQMEKSPHIAVILRIEPDHLDVHPDFSNYTNAKSNIARFQKPEDYCIFYRDNEESCRIAHLSSGTKIPYPLRERDTFVRGHALPENSLVLDGVISSELLPLFYVLEANNVHGAHNRENAEAAVAACASFFNQSLEDFIRAYNEPIKQAFKDFKGLPHRLQFVRELNNVEYYDDNYSSAFPAMDVALNTFGARPTILIAGGKDRHLDLSEAKKRIFSSENLIKAILIGETAPILAEGENPEKYVIAKTLPEAVSLAQSSAENAVKNTTFSAVVVMSPGAASFDMFKNFGDRGDKFQKLVQELK